MVCFSASLKVLSVSIANRVFKNVVTASISTPTETIHIFPAELSWKNFKLCGFSSPQEKAVVSRLTIQYLVMVTAEIWEPMKKCPLCGCVGAILEELHQVVKFFKK